MTAAITITAVKPNPLLIRLVSVIKAGSGAVRNKVVALGRISSFAVSIKTTVSFNGYISIVSLRMTVIGTDSIN